MLCWQVCCGMQQRLCADSGCYRCVIGANCNQSVLLRGAKASAVEEGGEMHWGAGMPRWQLSSSCCVIICRVRRTGR
jgi:hypothetical protein